MSDDIKPVAWKCRHGLSDNEPVECGERYPLYTAAALRQARNNALEEALTVLHHYRVPVGNSAAGELACEWTLDALRECAAAIRAMKEKRDE